MEAELSNSIALDDHLEKAPEPDKYSSRDNYNYVTNGQIMVTITLAEYRELVRGKADDEVSKARSERYDLVKERDELKKQVADLQKQLNDLRSMIANAVPMKAPADTSDE